MTRLINIVLVVVYVESNRKTVWEKYILSTKTSVIVALIVVKTSSTSIYMFPD